MRPPSRLVAFLGSCVLLAVPAVAYALSVHRADALKTISWDGQESLTSSRIEPDGSTSITYKVQLSWHATWSYDAATKTLRPNTGKVSGTASRLDRGQTVCSGAVTGPEGTPAVSIDSSGNVTFISAAIPGWPGDTGLEACFGPLPPPIISDYSRAKIAFNAKAKLSALANGTASASDSGGFTNTSTYQGSVCTKGCVAQTAAATGGYQPISGGTKAKPNPSDPIYTNRTMLVWSAKVSVGGGAAPPLNSVRKKLKHEEASAEFRKAGIDALVPCAKTAKEVVLKTIEMSTIAGEALELSLNALQPFVNAAFGGDPSKEATECAHAIARMIEAYRTYNSADPPDSAFAKVALPVSTAAPRSAACTHEQGKAAQICLDLVNAGLLRLGAQQRVAAVEDAIATTTNRLSTATAAGNATGVAVQNAALAALNGELAAALGAQDSADAALAGQLRRHHIHVVIVRPGLDGANKLIAQRTAALGIPAAQLQMFLAAQLSARSLDYSQALLAQVPTAFSTEIARTITLPGLKALYVALSDEHALTDAKLAAALTAASAASGGAQVTALRRFVNDAKQNGTEAGTLLAIAAAPLA